MASNFVSRSEGETKTGKESKTPNGALMAKLIECFNPKELITSVVTGLTNDFFKNKHFMRNKDFMMVAVKQNAYALKMASGRPPFFSQL